MQKTFQYIALTGLFIYAIFASTSIAICQGGIILALLGWAGKCIVSRRLLLPASPLNIPILLFLGLTLLAAVLGIDVPRSFGDLRTYTFVMLMFLVATMVPERKLVYLLWCSVVLAGAGGCIYFIVKHALSGTGVWLGGSMGEAGRLVPLFGVALGLTVHAQRWSRRIPLFLVVAVILVGGVLNLERGIWLGMIAAVVVVAWLRNKKLLLVLVVVIAACPLFPQVRARSLHAVGLIQRSTTGSRMEMWAIAPGVISEYPYGVGQDNPDITMGRKMVRSSHYHSNFVHIAIESGILGLIIWSWWMLVFMKLAYDTWKKLPEEKRFEKGVCLGVLAATVGFLVAGFFEYNYGDSEIAMMMYFLMGCVVLVWQGTRLPVEPQDDRMVHVTS